MSDKTGPPAKTPKQLPPPRIVPSSDIQYFSRVIPASYRPRNIGSYCILLRISKRCAMLLAVIPGLFGFVGLAHMFNRDRAWGIVLLLLGWLFGGLPA